MNLQKTIQDNICLENIIENKDYKHIHYEDIAIEIEDAHKNYIELPDYNMEFTDYQYKRLSY